MIREALLADITEIQRIRHSVKENVLSDPALVTDAACAEYISIRGKGWVHESGGIITGFAIADLRDHSIWALFMHPDFEGKGIGKQLHDTMLNWYFSQTQHTVWLSTSPGTRAERFYRMAGWKETGLYGKGELRFEMEYADWKCLHL